MKRIVWIKVLAQKVSWKVPGDSKPREASLEDLIKGYELFRDLFPSQDIGALYKLPVLKRRVSIE